MWAAVTTPQLFGHGKSHLGGDLFGAQEVFMRGLFEAATRKGNETLVAAHVRPLIDRHGKVAAAQKVARRHTPSLPSPACGGGKGGGHVAENRRIELGAGPHLSGAAVIHHDHAHPAIGLGLQDETTVEFERRAEQNGQNNRFAKQLGNRRRIGVAAENIVERRPQPDHPAAQVKSCDFERNNCIVGREVGGRTRRTLRGHYGRPVLKHQARMPFWAWRRFSASSKTTDCGPSMTSSVTSSPRWAGRQCMNMASGFALSISRALTW